MSVNAAIVTHGPRVEDTSILSTAGREVLFLTPVASPMILKSFSWTFSWTSSWTSTGTSSPLFHLISSLYACSWP